MTTTKAPVESWFYTQNAVEINDKDGNPRDAYQSLPHRIPRPENEEDQIVLAFLNSTNRPEFDGLGIECHLRIALRRAAEAAVRTTLDAEAGQGVVYETAEERAAGMDAPLPESEIAKAIKLQTVELARIADLFDSVCGEHHGFRFVTTGAIEWEE